MMWLREEALEDGCERSGTEIVSRSFVQQVLETGSIHGEVKMHLLAPPVDRSRDEVNEEYVSSLKREVDNLIAQQRVGIAWTRFLRSVERRSRAGVE